MNIKISAETIVPDDLSDLLEDIMLHAKSVAENYDSKSDFSQGMAQAYSEMLDMIANWSKNKNIPLNIDLADWAVKHLS